MLLRVRALATTFPGFAFLAAYGAYAARGTGPRFSHFRYFDFMATGGWGMDLNCVLVSQLPYPQPTIANSCDFGGICRA